MHAARAAVVALVLGAAATAAHAVAPVNVFGLRAPEEIAGFSLNDTVNFEKIKPGDGYGLDYSQSGWKLDVFIYDLKRSAIPDDARSAIVRAEFERARADAFLAQPSGIYAQVYLRRNFTIEDAGRRTRFQCAAFHLTRDGAKPQDGYVCVTSWNNKFVKLRLTTLSDSNTETAARKYVAAWIPVLWGGGYRAENPRSKDKAEAPAPAESEPTARAEAGAPSRSKPAKPPRAATHHGPSRPRKPSCPEGFICEYR